MSGYDDVRYWHLADNPTAPALIRYWSNSGLRMILAQDGLSANDPKRTYLRRRWFPAVMIGGSMDIVEKIAAL